MESLLLYRVPWLTLPRLQLTQPYAAQPQIQSGGKLHCINVTVHCQQPQQLFGARRLETSAKHRLCRPSETSERSRLCRVCMMMMMMSNGSRVVVACSFLFVLVAFVSVAAARSRNKSATARYRDRERLHDSSQVAYSLYEHVIYLLPTIHELTYPECMTSAWPPYSVHIAYS